MRKLLLFIILFVPFSVKSISTIAMDINSKQIYYENNIHDRRSVASISKIMTAIVALESNKANDIVTIGSEINKSYGSGIYIKENEHISLLDLIYGLMLRSGNDASFSIAKYVGGTIDNFVDMMNSKASEIGMRDSVFNNPNGLEDNGGNISTAYDMALLTSYAMHNDLYRKIVSTKKHIVKTDLNYYSWVNKNKLLLNYKYTTGGKTGFTEVAKRTLVTTASKNDMDIVVVTLNDGNDFNDHKKIYEDIFKTYKGYNILSEGSIDIANENYYNSNYYIKNSFYYSLTELEKNNIILKFELEKKDKYKDDDEIGKVKIYLGDKFLNSSKIYIKSKEKVTFWQKIANWLFND